jgi:serine/threonine protein kinase
VELFNFTLDKLTDFRDEVILSILFQILFAVATIQVEYGMFHNDIKKENILVKVIPSGGYWEYNLNGEKYYVPNHGYFVALNDFGVSLVFRPKISNREDYGRRQAKVVQNYTDNTFYFEPFTTKFYPSVSKTGVVTAIKSHRLAGNLTWNHFYKNFDPKPSIPVDLEDTLLFPVHHFHYDVLDTIYTFIGGKRTSQPGRHPAMKVSKNIQSLLENFYLIKSSQAWPKYRVDLFLAKYTIMKLFPFYLNSTLSGPLIDVYYL